MKTAKNNTIENYKTLACEVALYAFNDYIRYSIALYSMEHPDEAPHIEQRYKEIVKTIGWDMNSPKKGIRRRYYKEFKHKKALLREKIQECEDFFTGPDTLAGFISLDEEALERADDLVDKWISTGKLELLPIIRVERG